VDAKLNELNLEINPKGIDSSVLDAILNRRMGHEGDAPLRLITNASEL